MKYSTTGSLSALLLSLILLFCQAQANAQAIELKLQPAAGVKYAYTFQFISDVAVDQGTVNMDIGVGLTMEVTGTEGTNKILKATYDRMAMKMDMGTNTMDIDTDQPQPAFNANDPMTIASRLFHGLKGQSFNMKVSEAGDLVEITGFETIVDKMVESATAGTGIPDAAKQGMRDGMSKQFNAESMKEQLQQAFNIFTSKPVKVGDSWEKKIGTSGNKKMKMTNTYTVRSISDREVVLAVRSVVDEMVTDNGVTMTGNQEGTVVVEPATGMLIRSEMTQHFDSKEGGGLTISGKMVTARK